VPLPRKFLSLSPDYQSASRGRGTRRIEKYVYVCKNATQKKRRYGQMVIVLIQVKKGRQIENQKQKHKDTFVYNRLRKEMKW